MNENTKPKADYAPNEKKVWRPEYAVPMPAPENMKPGIYFLAIEELQGAWIDGEWEEADGTEVWDEQYTDKDGNLVTRTVTKEIPRSRRYVLKRFTETGFAENAFSGSFSGPRQYKK